MDKIWYIIVNPTSGNGSAKKKWARIVLSLDANKIRYHFAFSAYQNHEQNLVYSAIETGYRKFISVGGDGTLHHIVNGIMNQSFIKPSAIKVAAIPLGTGNDWVKTYKIPKKIKNVVSIIKNENSTLQDIGYLEMADSERSVYFNNLAGLGFDGFVVKNVLKFKKYGSFAYLLGALTSFIEYRKSQLSIEFDDMLITTKSLLTLVGICRYSGGGMQLTKNVQTADGLFDISIAKNFNLFSVLFNIVKFYNGKITNHSQVETFKTNEINITCNDKNSFVQADGELIGVGGFRAKIIPSAIRFVIP